MADKRQGYRNPELIVSAVNDNFNCGICLEMLDNPVMCPEGHNFCKSCLEQAMMRKKECPLCRTKLSKSKMTTNRALERVMEDIVVVKCPTTLSMKSLPDPSHNVEQICKKRKISEDEEEEEDIVTTNSSGTPRSDSHEGTCTWQGFMSDVQAHIESCRYVTYPCPHDGCNEQLFRNELQQHSEICPERVVKCSHCEKQIKSRTVVDHEKFCDMRLVPCPNGCSDENTGQMTMYPLKLLCEHRMVCREEEIQCPYWFMGCKEKCNRKDMVTHKQDMNAHCTIIMSTICELQRGSHSVSYTSIFNKVICGDLNAWQQVKDLADCGDNIAKIYVMEAYVEGKGQLSSNRMIAKNIAVALLPWLRYEAYRGSSLHALHGLGVCHEHGLGVAVDEKAAVMWYRVAADQGHPRAQFNLANCYRYGEGVDNNDKEYFMWSKLAADQGQADAQNNVGCCYEYGTGAAVNEVEAFQWFRRAAKQGFADSLFNVSCFYKYGRGGVTEDAEEAFKWFTLYVERGGVNRHEGDFTYSLDE